MLTFASTVVALMFAIILMASGWSKLRRRAWFEETLRQYAVLPEPLLGIVAWVLPLLELTTGAMLCAAPTRPVGAALSMLLLLGFAGVMQWSLRRGNVGISCGCGGLSAEQPVSVWLVRRNVVLSAAAAPALVPVSSSMSPTYWVAAVMAVATTLLLYVAYNELVRSFHHYENLRKVKANG